jgi:hypothetical protein
MPQQATLEQNARLVAIFSVGEAVIHLRITRPRVVGQQELDRALAALAAGDSGTTRHELLRFAGEQRVGAAREAIAGMRARAAAMAIVDALARRAEFFSSTQVLQWGGLSANRIVVP